VLTNRFARLKSNIHKKRREELQRQDRRIFLELLFGKCLKWNAEILLSILDSWHIQICSSVRIKIHSQSGSCNELHFARWIGDLNGTSMHQHSKFL
jgi:hypothetical protein